MEKQITGSSNRFIDFPESTVKKPAKRKVNSGALEIFFQAKVRLSLERRTVSFFLPLHFLGIRVFLFFVFFILGKHLPFIIGGGQTRGKRKKKEEEEAEIVPWSVRPLNLSLSFSKEEKKRRRRKRPRGERL